MKKFLSVFLVLILLFSCVACGKTEPTNSDSENTTESTTESTTKHTTDEESATEDVSESENTTLVEDNTTKVQGEEETTKDNNTTTTKKNETTTKKAETTTQKPSANTTTNPTTKPTEKPTTTSNPYFVSMELVSVDRFSDFYVDGMHVLDRVFGKNTRFQKGDTITYKINMSDGGKTGFKLKDNGWRCNASINGNLLTVKITGTDGLAEASIVVDTKNGTKTISKEFVIYEDVYDLNTTNSQDRLLQEYAYRKGLILLNGCDEENYKRYVVKIPGNSNWFSEALASIDEAKSLGYTRYCYQLVPQDAFAMMVYK